MDKAPNDAHRVTLSVMADLVATFETGDPNARRAQAALGAATELRGEEATVEEIEEVIDRGLHPAIVGGAAVAGTAALLGGLFALRRRGRDQSDEADRAIEDASVSRREMLGLIAIGGVGLGAGDVLLRSQLPVAAAEREPVNVIAIIVDDLNDYPTFMGGAPMAVHTPNLDALAAESRTFVNHHVTVPICPPSRSTLMWGFDVAAHQQTSSDLINSQYDAFSTAWADESIIAIAGRGGVETYGGGKVFHSDQFPQRWSKFVRNRWSTAAPGTRVGFDHGPLLDDRNPDEDLINEMIAVLGEQPTGSPFLMVPGLRLPHLPWRVPQRFLDMYPIGDIVLPETPEDDWSDLGPVATAQLEQFIEFWGAGWYEVVESHFERRELMRAYLASMSHTDAMVGRLLDALASSRHAETTVVMLVSDNGYHQGENFAYRKLTLRSQATRTPFMIRGIPGAEFTPGVVRQPLSSTSFMPTLLDLLGLETDVPRGGPSLVGGGQPPPVALSHVHNSVSALFSDADHGAWRWTLHFERGKELEPGRVSIEDVAEMELYNQATDAGEFENLLFTV